MYGAEEADFHGGGMGWTLLGLLLAIPIVVLTFVQTTGSCPSEAGAMTDRENQLRLGYSLAVLVVTSGPTVTAIRGRRKGFHWIPWLAVSAVVLLAGGVLVLRSSVFCT